MTMDAHATANFTGASNKGLQVGQNTGTINNYAVATDEDQTCLKDLFITDPRRDKVRIQQTKGGLLISIYEWILHTPAFKRWQTDAQCRLLWISGDPGKGKTMLLCGIIDAMQTKGHPLGLSYFFCQATDARINSATAVLRGLVWTLASQQPALIRHIREQYDLIGKKIFEGPNTWVTLTEILTRMLRDPIAQPIYLFIDALDECLLGLPALLDFIETSPPDVKWIVTSRNWPEIKEKLDDSYRLSLEINAESVAGAVRTFVKYKLTQLSKRKRYDQETQIILQEHLINNSNDTFLWVALVCERLNAIPGWSAISELHQFPPGLDTLYDRMLGQVEEAHENELLIRVLGIIAIVRRPLTLSELRVIVDLPSPSNWSEQLIEQCGSFLTIRDSTIYFVHQSAKDFLLGSAYDRIFPLGNYVVHDLILSKLLEAMTKILDRNMYLLGAPGVSIEKIVVPHPDPLQSIRYACIHWVSHLERSSKAALQDQGIVEKFLRGKFIYWLEALSLLKIVNEGVRAILDLEHTLKGENASHLATFVSDALRLVQLRRWVIENSPLQIYASGLLFSPTTSLVRKAFEFELTAWSQQARIRVQTQLPMWWSACTQLLEGHYGPVTCVAFSPNGSQLASCSWDMAIILWDVQTGHCQCTLEGHSDIVTSVVFSRTGPQLISGSWDNTIRVWDLQTGRCQSKLKSHLDGVTCVVLSPDETQLVSGSSDKTIRLWDIRTGQYQQLFKRSKGITSVALSPDGSLLASSSHHNDICYWDLRAVHHLHTLSGHRATVKSVEFSPCGSKLASGSVDKTIRIWDIQSGQCQRIIDGHFAAVSSIKFSPDGLQLASGSDMTIRIWEVQTGQCQRILEGHFGKIKSVAFSPDGSKLASGSFDDTIRLWELQSNQHDDTLESHSIRTTITELSPNGSQLASGSEDGTVLIRYTQTGQCQHILEGHYDRITSLTFSPNGTQLASASRDRSVRLWHVRTGRCQYMLAHPNEVTNVVFSSDGLQLASSSVGTIRLWDVQFGQCQRTLRGHSGTIINITFSPDGSQLASDSNDSCIRIWNIQTGQCQYTLKGHIDHVMSMVFSSNGLQLGSSSFDGTIRLWDLRSGKCSHKLEGNFYDDCSITFSPDGSQLVSVSDINTIRLWNIATIATVERYDVVVSPNTKVEFNDDGTRLIVDGNLLPTFEKQPLSTAPARLLAPAHQTEPQILGVEDDWITLSMERILWLPPEYRPGDWMRRKNVLVIRTGTGRVVFISLR